MTRSSLRVCGWLCLAFACLLLSACAADSGDSPDGDEAPREDGDLSDGDDGDTEPDGDTDGDENGEELPADPNEQRLGGFVIRYEPESQAVSIASGDGRVLLSPPAPLSVSGEEPPGGQFAVRHIDIGYTMLFGAFKPNDTPHGPWIDATRVTWTREAGSLVLGLENEAGSLLAELHLRSPGPGHLEISSVTGGEATRISIGFGCEAGDHFMGFGSQTWDVDHRGQTVACWVQEQGVGKVDHNDYSDPDWMLVGRRNSAHLPIPQFVARRGYAAVVESYGRPVFALCSEREDRARIEMHMGDRLHLFDGPAPARALERSSAVFGRPRIPPAYAFAPWLDAIHGAEDVLEEARALRREGVPASVIWTEDWKGATQQGRDYVLSEEWELDRELYPDFEGLVEELNALGFASFIYFNTFIYAHASIFEAVTGAGYTVKKPDGSPYLFSGHKMPHKASVVDFSNPEARAWVKERLEAALSLGVDGWMGDFAEWLPADAVTHEETGFLQHNKHPVQWQELQREALDEATARDGRERLFFGRSGWLGTPPLADVIWAGDQSTTFFEDDGIKTVLPIGIGLGVVGVSTFGHDIAGYMARFNDPTDRELFFRWTSLGAWSPVMRTHHGYQASLNWRWNNDAQTIAHFRDYARLHIALTPTWRGLAKIAHETGLSIWRGLGLMFPQDATVWPIKDQVMVGDSILVAPILDRAQTPEAAVSREVYLPQGVWYPWEAGAPVEGPQRLVVQAGMEEIPVFVRAGGLVPLYPDGVLTLVYASPEFPGPESVGDDRIVKVYLGASGHFEEAEGLSYELEQLSDATGDLLAYRNEEALPPCADDQARNCVSSPGAGRLVVRVSGETPVLLTDSSGEPRARLRAEGGDQTRRIDWQIAY